MLQIGICDDDKVVAAELERNIESITSRKMLEHEIGVFYDGDTLIDYFMRGNRFDIIYLDIQMEKLDGIEVAKQIRIIDKDVILIYVSGYDSYLMELFEVEPFRFIKKPVDEVKFEEIFLKAYDKVLEQAIYFNYKYNKMDYKIMTNDILYFESSGRTINIIIEKDERRKFYGKLDDVEESFSSSKIPFLRIHKSYLINFNKISSINYAKVVMHNGDELQISEERQRKIRHNYFNIIKKEMDD